MKVVVLYRPKSEYGGKVLDFAAEYKRTKNRELKLISLDSVEGDNMARLYGVSSYPAILATSEDGSLQKMWQGGAFPLQNELDYYMSL